MSGTDQSGTKKKKKGRGFRGYLHLGFSFWKKMSGDQIDVYSAQAAFFLFMSLVPMLMMMLILLRLTPILTEEEIMETMASILNAEVMELVRNIVASLYHGSMAGMFFVMLGLLFMCGRGMMGISKGLNRIYRLKENRNYFYLRFRSTFYTLIMLGTLLLAMWMLVNTARAGDAVFTSLGFLRIRSRGLRFLAAVIMLVTMTLIFNILYTFLPNQKKRYKSQIPGAVFSTCSWTVFSMFFLIYVTFSKNLSIFYGGLLTIGVGMLWLYWCIYLFFFGAELNAYLENPDSFPF